MSSKKRKEKGQFRHKVESKLVILRENRENLASSIRHDQKGQKMPEPSSSPPEIGRLPPPPPLPPPPYFLFFSGQKPLGGGGSTEGFLKKLMRDFFLHIYARAHTYCLNLL